MKEVKEGDWLFTGRIADAKFAETYNNLTKEIAFEESLGWNVEPLKDLRHWFFTCYALGEI